MWSPTVRPAARAGVSAAPAGLTSLASDPASCHRAGCVRLQGCLRTAVLILRNSFASLPLSKHLREEPRPGVFVRLGPSTEDDSRRDCSGTGGGRALAAPCSSASGSPGAPRGKAFGSLRWGGCRVGSSFRSSIPGAASDGTSTRQGGGIETLGFYVGWNNRFGATTWESVQGGSGRQCREGLQILRGPCEGERGLVVPA